jgi:hypothetical protein
MWFTTLSGRRIEILKPDPYQVQIEDIAPALAKICRFNGHVREFYSVAQHCVLASQNAPEGLEFAALMHDAHEAYVQDMIGPMKKAVPNFKTEIERPWENAMRERFALPSSPLIDRMIKRVDQRLLATERRDLIGLDGRIWPDDADPFLFKIVPWEWRLAEDRFLDRFHQLFPKGAEAVFG